MSQNSKRFFKQIDTTAPAAVEVEPAAPEAAPVETVPAPAAAKPKKDVRAVLDECLKKFNASKE